MESAIWILQVLTWITAVAASVAILAHEAWPEEEEINE